MRGAGVEPRIDANEVAQIRAETFAPMEHENGVSGREIIHLAQEAMAPCDYVMIKTERRMKEALVLVDKAKDMSRICGQRTITSSPSAWTPGLWS